MDSNSTYQKLLIRKNTTQVVLSIVDSVGTMQDRTETVTASRTLQGIVNGSQARKTHETASNLMAATSVVVSVSSLDISSGWVDSSQMPVSAPDWVNASGMRADIGSYRYTKVAVLNAGTAKTEFIVSRGA